MENDKKSSVETEDVGQILDYESPVHGRLLLCRLAKLRDNSRLCDVTLVAKGARINAHRVVLAAATDYFEAMFTNDMAESHSETIELKDVEASALEALINFCYYGKIRISNTNVWSVLPAACLLQLNEVKEQCSEFLEKRLSASNCLKIRALADTYTCDGLLRCAHEYILHNFKDVIGTDEFYRLSDNLLIELISSEKLQVPSEEQVFEAVVEWVRFDLPARQQLFPQLFEHVQLSLCDPKFLINTVSKESLVKADAVCRNLVDEAKDHQLLQFSTTHGPSVRKSRSRLGKVSTGEMLYVDMKKKASLGEEHVQTSFPDMPAIPSVDTAIILADFTRYAGHANSESGQREQG